MKFDPSSDTNHQFRVSLQNQRVELILLNYLGCSDYAPQDHLHGYPSVWAELFAEHLRRKFRTQEASIKYSLPDIVIWSYCKPQAHLIREDVYVTYRSYSFPNHQENYLSWLALFAG